VTVESGRIRLAARTPEFNIFASASSSNYRFRGFRKDKEPRTSPLNSIGIAGVRMEIFGLLKKIGPNMFLIRQFGELARRNRVREFASQGKFC